MASLSLSLAVARGNYFHIVNGGRWVQVGEGEKEAKEKEEETDRDA